MIGVSKSAGFVQSLFNGVIDKELLKPFPVYEKEEKEDVSAILEMVQKFAKDKIDPVQIDLEHKFPDSVREGFAELGLWGLIIPEEYGGFDQSEFTYNKAMEILNGACTSTAITYGGHLSIGLKAILLSGSEEQKRKFLPELASGEKIAAFALTEPGAGSDAAGIKTTAELSEDGKYYILNGQKQWITNGGFAEVYTVLAKIKKAGEDPDASKTTAFIVTRDMEGFSSGKEENKLGICGTSTTPLVLDNVKVPVENVLGGVGGGFKMFMEVLNTGRLSLAAGWVGAAKALIPHALDFALQRVQFGKTVSEFGMIKEKFAQVTVNTFTTESMVYYSTFLKETHNAEISLESAICKVFGSEALWQTVNHCLQVAGGNGYMKEYPFERFLRDSRINLIFEGTNEILRMFIAVSGTRQLSVGLKGIGRKLSENPEEREKQIQEIIEKDNKPSGAPDIGFSDKLDSQLELAAGLTKSFSESIKRVLLRYGREYKNMQFIQKRLAESAMDMYGIYANISRVENLFRNNHHTAEDAMVVSDVFSKQAADRINKNLADIENNNDEDLSKLAEMLYENKKYPFDILEY